MIEPITSTQEQTRVMTAVLAEQHRQLAHLTIRLKALLYLAKAINYEASHS